jgi:phage tail-like protein
MADTLLRAFRFQVKLRRTSDGRALGDGAFQECSGLEIEVDVKEHLEGGNNNAVIRQVGRAKYPNLVLKRGMFYGSSGGVNQDLWNWVQGVVSGRRPVERYDGSIEVMSVGFEVAAVWSFSRGVPARLRGPELNGKTGELAIEELHIAHEGLLLVNP